jgi:hypothetical protein
MAISGTMGSGEEITLSDAVVSIDLGDTGTYVAVPTWVTSVAPSGGDTPTAELPRLAGDTLVGVGRKAARVLQVTAVYTEEATGVFRNVYEAYEDGDLACDIKFTKKGATTGDLEFETVEGKMTSCSLPSPSASEATPATFTFSVMTQSVLMNVIGA